MDNKTEITLRCYEVNITLCMIKFEEHSKSATVPPRTKCNCEPYLTWSGIGEF